MARLLKMTLSTVFIVIVLVVLAVVILPLLIDPNDYKIELQSAVKENTGRDLEIKGDLELSVFPWLGVSTGELILGNASGFSETTFAKIKASHIKVKLLPLISKKIELSRIELKGLSLSLVKNEKGVNNWGDLLQAKGPEEQAQQPKKQEADVSPMASLALGGVSIEQAKIVWDDRQNNNHIELNDLNFQTGRLAFNQPIKIELSLQLINKEPSLTESAGFSADLIVNEQLNSIKLANVNIKSITSGQAIPGGVLTANLQSDFHINLTDKMISVVGLRLDLDDLTEEKLGVSFSTNAEINLARQSIDTSGLSLKANGLMNDKLSANLLADISADLTEQTLNISELKLNAGEMNLSADLVGKQIMDNPSVKGVVNIAPFNLAQFLQNVAIVLPEMQGVNALNQLSVEFNVLATKDTADVQDLVVNLDDSKITGSVSAKNFSNLESSFNINVDSIDVGHYLPPEANKEAKKTVVTPASSAVAVAELFPVEVLRGLNTKGKVSIGSLKVNQLSMKGVDLQLDSSRGFLQTHQKINELYQGSYSGSSFINVQNKIPKIAMDETLSNIQIEPLLQALKIETRMSGLINATAKIQSSGNSVPAIKSSLVGDVKFSFKDSIIRGFNLQKIIDSGRLLLEGKKLPAENKKDQTVFSIIKGTAKIKNGLVTNDDLLAESSKLRVVGKGTASIKTEGIDYSVDARLLKPDQKDKFRGVPLAVKIGGNFSKPSYQLDLEAMLKAKYQDKIDKTINKNKDKILKKLDKELAPGIGDALKSFF